MPRRGGGGGGERPFRLRSNVVQSQLTLLDERGEVLTRVNGRFAEDLLGPGLYNGVEPLAAHHRCRARRNDVLADLDEAAADRTSPCPLSTLPRNVRATRALIDWESPRRSVRPRQRTQNRPHRAGIEAHQPQRQRDKLVLAGLDPAQRQPLDDRHVVPGKRGVGRQVL